MRLQALLETDELGLRLLGGGDELDRTVRGVMTTDLRDPSRYLKGGELVLTGLAWRHSPEDSERFVRILASAGVAGLAAGEAEQGAIPDDLVRACAKHHLPLFAVDENVAFAAITELVVRQVSTERAGDLAAVVERHRRLMSSGPEGGGPDAVLGLLDSDLDLRAFVLSPIGRQIAGVAPGLSHETGAALAGEHLAAQRGSRPGPHRTAVRGRRYSLFPVRRGADAEVRGSALSDWLLAVEADSADWPAERLDLVRGVAQLIAVERDRRDAARMVRRRLAQEVLDLVQAGASPAEVAARLRVAGPVLLPGVGTGPHWQVEVATVEWSGEQALPSGSVAQALLEEVLADPFAAGGDPSERIAVAHDGIEAVALVPMPSGEEQKGELLAADLLAAIGGPLAMGLAADGRLTVGVSATVHSAEGLRGALEEARHARRVAAARPGQVCVAGHEELASHVLLLPFVPDDVRRAFTARLLEPLRGYDQRHRAELVPTLEAFLECDGSWTRCATRLHLHVNTLRYRIGRIEQLTGRDLSRLEDKLDFFLALRMS
jgi:hypothetical protein